MTARRLRAPATDGGLLVEPPWGEVRGLAASNAGRLSGWDYDVQGRQAARLRDLARREIVHLAREFLRRHGLEESPAALESPGSPHVPLVVTGHQPELFHPGVWVKNFAASAIARSCGGIALEPDRRQRYPQGLIHPRAGRSRRPHPRRPGRLRRMGGRAPLRGLESPR